MTITGIQIVCSTGYTAYQIGTDIRLIQPNTKRISLNEEITIYEVYYYDKKRYIEINANCPIIITYELK